MINEPSKRLRIAHLCNYYQPQLGYQEHFLSAAHAQLGHDVYVVTSERYAPFPDYDNTVRPVLGPRLQAAGTVYRDGLTVIRLPVLHEYSARVWLKGLERTLLNLRPDLVICHGMMNWNALRTAWIKTRLGCKIFYDDHMLRSEEKKGLVGRFGYACFPFRHLLRAGDRIIGVSAECVDFIHEKYGIARDRIEFVPLGADTSLFRFDASLRDRFRQEHGISDDAVVVTYTGKLTAAKGPHQIMEALSPFPTELQKPLSLVFVGNIEASYRGVFTAALDKLDKRIHVVRLPAVANNDLVAVYCGSDIAAWPRQGSMSMIEAAAVGLPIICCDFLRERYEAGNGIPIREDNLQDLRHALITLITDPPQRRAMGEKGRLMVDTKMSWRAIALRYLEGA